MNRLDAKTRATVLNCLIEGCSIRSTVRLTGVSKKAISRLLVEAGDMTQGTIFVSASIATHSHISPAPGTLLAISAVTVFCLQ